MTSASLLRAAPDVIAAAARRVMARCEELARVSAAAASIERVYLSPEHARVNRLAAEWMRELGMRTWQDAAGNQVGRIGDPAAPALMLGSHLDTVLDAGRYDGIAGVLMALEVVRLLRVPVGGDGDAAGDGWTVPLPFAIEVVAFSDEEGTRFGKALLGSSAVAGTWSDAWWELTDADGVSLRRAFLEFGLDPARVGEAARRPDELVGYLEAHIEQGPELDRAGEPLAVVSSIASARRFQLVVEGEARHAGGTPYDMRRDALLGASEAALAVERICSAEHHIVGTVGRFEAFPGAVNVIPGEVQFSLDLRGEFDGERDRVWDALARELDEIMGRRALRWRSREVHSAPAVFCAPLLQDVVAGGIRAALPPRSDAPPVIFSRAGHDGMSLGAVTDVGMLFLRNPDGVSHHPDESVSAGDVAHGIRALAEAVLLRGTERV
ncbi:allantoate amidohydrolase [Microbacterium laevaniformans]|uniref:N-carbamoyl-L-amino acid hydrolase n=1 Tax=Microbacterium laevaniformans TaxID=36807 RepID=A0A150HH47_9MICO|nr:Zn-dependent hydrolase [Microbacterium laevaniformans]KXZ61244.1 N-carbamoyl-L-amino acid hydrolase [Microbacterium laevaniformans]MBM7753886.1 allantoate deiminase [Microbacterium laevaniformans]GLJ63188.1 Zn-dependent hydrolase [Microbacterium laevaniformans]